MRIILSVLLCLFAVTAYSDDTLLLGYDCATAYDGPECSWVDDATTISGGKWKANRFLAHASGTITTSSYFQMRVPNTPTGCTSDDGCFALYEGGTSSTIGDLKAYTCWSGYNWTTTGVGVHNFTAETINNSTITQGQYYWMVVWSQALDADNYSGAGCSQQIYAYRGPNDDTCLTLGGVFDEIPIGSCGGSGCVAIEEVGYTSVPPPPAGTAYDVGTATYRMMGFFSGEDEGPAARTIQGITIQGVTIQ